jgi:uncharacterized membrane protein YhaH (DUF805 family)
MGRAIVEEIATLASLALFVGMVAICAKFFHESGRSEGQLLRAKRGAAEAVAS